LNSRRGYGGKTIYGARVGILMLDTKWPRPPGDTGNAHTWPFPVIYKVVPGASARVVIHEQGKGLGQAFLDAAAELGEGRRRRHYDDGRLSLDLQDQLGARQGAIASFLLMQIPLVQRLLPPGKRVGYCPCTGPRYSRALEIDEAQRSIHLSWARKADANYAGPPEDEMEMDYEKAEQDILEASDKLLQKHPEVGALVLETHNMAPIRARSTTAPANTGVRVYVRAMVSAGLEPRDFGWPGTSTPPVWQER
jgi:hypothetical protein